MTPPSITRRPSRITIPAHAHPIVRLTFQLMKMTATSYFEMELRSGLLASTLKSYRKEKVPSLQSAEAVLGVFGYRLVPCPPIDNLPEDVREALEEVGQHFISDDETLAAAIIAATSKAGARGSRDEPAPRLLYRQPYWDGATGAWHNPISTIHNIKDAA